MAGPYKWDTKVIFLTPEVTKGTPAAVTAADAVITMNGSVTPMDGGEVELPLDGRDAAATESYATNLHQSLSFETPLCPPSAAATAPHWGPVGRLMSMDETVVATTRVEYVPTLTSQEAFTGRYYQDGQARVLAGLMGGGTIRLTNGQVPLLAVQAKGNYAAGTAASAPAAVPNYATYRQPQVISFDNTPTCTFDGVDLMFESLELNLGNNPEFNNRPNYVGAEVNAFNPTGTLVFLDPGVAALNVEAMLDAKKALRLIHYTAAGTQVGLLADSMQVGRASHTNVGGKRAISLPVRFTRPAAGGPAFKLWSGTAPA